MSNVRFDDLELMLMAMFEQPTLRDTIQMLMEIQPLVAEDAEMAALVQQTIQKLQKLVSENHLDSEVDLNGDFCSGNCRKGVCVTVDGELYSVKPETTEEFFQKEILGRLNA